MHKYRVEDWERSFQEKSRRRADKERRRARKRIAVYAGILGAIVLVTILAFILFN